jgi:hypothetical protein
MGNDGAGSARVGGRYVSAKKLAANTPAGQAAREAVTAATGPVEAKIEQDMQRAAAQNDRDVKDNKVLQEAGNLVYRPNVRVTGEMETARPYTDTVQDGVLLRTAATNAAQDVLRARERMGRIAARDVRLAGTFGPENTPTAEAAAVIPALKAAKVGGTTSYNGKLYGGFFTDNRTDAEALLRGLRATGQQSSMHPTTGGGMFVALGRYGAATRGVALGRSTRISATEARQRLTFRGTPSGAPAAPGAPAHTRVLPPVRPRRGVPSEEVSGRSIRRLMSQIRRVNGGMFPRKPSESDYRLMIHQIVEGKV